MQAVLISIVPLMQAVLISIVPLMQAVLWDIRGCVLSKRLLGHGGGVFGVELDSNGHTAFTASGDKVIITMSVAILPSC